MKRKSKRRLHDKAWKVFSEYVRRKDANFNGYAPCFTCGKQWHWKELDAGHFFHSRLDFDEMNVNPQCTGCNRFRHGKHNTYGVRLAQLYGAQALVDLERRSLQKGNDYSIEELEYIITKYTSELGNIPN